MPSRIRYICGGTGPPRLLSYCIRCRHAASNVLLGKCGACGRFGLHIILYIHVVAGTVCFSAVYGLGTCQVVNTVCRMVSLRLGLGCFYRSSSAPPVRHRLFSPCRRRGVSIVPVSVISMRMAMPRQVASGLARAGRDFYLQLQSYAKFVKRANNSLRNIKIIKKIQAVMQKCLNQQPQHRRHTAAPVPCHTQHRTLVAPLSHPPRTSAAPAITPLPHSPSHPCTALSAGHQPPVRQEHVGR